MDKFKALTYFAETAESGSFSVAAKRFGVPASSISRRISDLEADLGAQLLLRSTRSVSLTEIGEQYLLQVNSILQQVKQSEKSVRSYQDQPSGTLKISSMVGLILSSSFRCMLICLQCRFGHPAHLQCSRPFLQRKQHLFLTISDQAEPNRYRTNQRPVFL